MKVLRLLVSANYKMAATDATGRFWNDPISKFTCFHIVYIWHVSCSYHQIRDFINLPGYSFIYDRYMCVYAHVFDNPLYLCTVDLLNVH